MIEIQDFVELCNKLYNIRIIDSEKDPAVQARENLRRMGNVLG